MLKCFLMLTLLAYVTITMTNGQYNPVGVISSCPVENKKLACNSNNKYSLIDGSCNNLQNPWVGKMNTPYKRYGSNTYADGWNAPRQNSVTGSVLPNPRVISRMISGTDQSQETQVNHLFTLFGQFVAHDITLANTVPGIYNILLYL